MRQTTTLFLFFTVSFLTACDTGPGKSPEQIQAEAEAHQKKFAEEMARIERENKKREEMIAEQRSYITARFVSVDEQRVEVSLHNETGKPIDNSSGALEVFDTDGNSVFGIALGNWVPGDIYLPAGVSAQAIYYLDLQPEEERKRIIDEARSFSYYFTIFRIQFAGEPEISYLEAMGLAIPDNEVPSPAPENPSLINNVTADPCSDNQISLETEELYYPGPKCEHVERNIDSERFKQEFIQLCKKETGAASPPASTALVEISSCGKAPDRPGIVYRKRICCDVSS